MGPAAELGPGVPPEVPAPQPIKRPFNDPMAHQQ
jgi:hypothetical protein